jgi:hypothetical protein
MDFEETELPCKDKLAFDTPKEAAAAANFAQYTYGQKMYPYCCRHCRLWHLSSSAPDND